MLTGVKQMINSTLIGQLVVGVAIVVCFVSRGTCQSHPDESDHDFIQLSDERHMNTQTFIEKLVAGKESCYYSYARDSLGVIFRV